jgi:hypothetical protein
VAPSYSAPQAALISITNLCYYTYIAFCQTRGIGYDNASMDVVGIRASVYRQLHPVGAENRVTV